MREFCDHVGVQAFKVEALFAKRLAVIRQPPVVAKMRV